MTGKMIRHYRIEESLGQGGMGVVWKAVDTTLGRPVAIKILKSSESRQRFLREARSASSLNHHGIVTIYEIGAEDGQDFIVMEYVSGKTLSRELTGGGLPLPKFFDYAAQLATAVAYAHDRGVVHRDLKPGNIMINEDGRLKILDFGLAKMIGLSSSDTSDPNATATMTLTHTGVVVGTAAYMSPEQASAEPLDHRSDIFSLGVILYEMLTGHNPFRGQSLITTLQNVCLKHLPPPSSVRPDLPPVLEAVLDRALAKQPDQRYASARDLKEDLEKIWAPVSSRSDQLAEPVSVASRRSPRLSVLAAWKRQAAVALSATVLAGYWAFWSGWRPFPGRLSPSLRSSYDYYQQGQQLLREANRPGNLDRALEAMTQALRMDGRYALAHAGLSQCYLLKHRQSPDPALLNLALDSARTATRLADSMAVTHLRLGAALFESGDRTGGLAELQRAVDLDPQNADAHSTLGTATASVGKPREAEASLRRAVELAPGEGNYHHALAIFLYREHRYAESLDAFLRAQKALPHDGAVAKNLGAAYYQLGRLEEAASAFQRSLEIEPSGSVYTNLGTLRFSQGRYAESAALMEEALKHTPNRFNLWGNLADAYRFVPGAEDKADRAYRQAVALLGERLAATPSDADLRSLLAVYLAKSKQRQQARAEIERALSAGEAKASVFYRAAVVFELTGDRAAALAHLARAAKAGYSPEQIRTDPELISLRRDLRYHLSER